MTPPPRPPLTRQSQGVFVPVTCGSHGTVASAREERPGSGPQSSSSAVLTTHGLPWGRRCGRRAETRLLISTTTSQANTGDSPSTGGTRGRATAYTRMEGQSSQEVTGDASLDTDVPGGNTLCSNCAANVTRRQASCGRAPGGRARAGSQQDLGKASFRDGPFLRR